MPSGPPAGLSSDRFEVTVCRSCDTQASAPRCSTKWPRLTEAGDRAGGACAEGRPCCPHCPRIACSGLTGMSVAVKTPGSRTDDPAGSWLATCEAEGRLAGPPRARRPLGFRVVWPGAVRARPVTPLPRARPSPGLGDWLPRDSWEAASHSDEAGTPPPALGGHRFLGGLTKSHLPGPPPGQHWYQVR